MPDPALPVSRVEPLPGTVTYRQVFRDALGRPLTGKVTILGQKRHEVDGSIILPAPATVPLVEGVLEVNLPPDTYQVTASLATREGAKVADIFEITL